MERSYQAGVDEAGRGPLAGPVVAAAVILNPDRVIPGLADSKKLTPAKRDFLFDKIIRDCLAYGIASASPEEIDSLNILQATLLAMQRAILALESEPATVVIDGPHCPELPYPTTGIIRGDSQVPAISAASILAKVTRDRAMCLYDQEYPGYGFAKHKGYPTKAHRLAIKEKGYTPIHRLSFQIR